MDKKLKAQLTKQLFDAVKAGREDEVRQLLDRGADIRQRNDDWGYTPLHVAIVRGNERLVRLLLERGADLNDRTYAGQTALVLAVSERRDSIARFFIEQGADVNARANYGVTALHSASWSGNEPLVRLLLERGANVNAKTDYENRTPLHSASEMGHEPVVRLLLEHGADIDVRTYGKTAAKLAKTKSIQDLLKRKEAARNLVAIGHQTQFPPEVNAEVMKYLVPRRELSPAEQQAKNEQYQAMVRAGPAVAALHRRKRTAEATGGKKKTRRTRNSRRLSRR